MTRSCKNIVASKASWRAFHSEKKSRIYLLILMAPPDAAYSNRLSKVNFEPTAQILSELVWSESRVLLGAWKIFTLTVKLHWLPTTSVCLFQRASENMNSEGLEKWY